MKLLAGRRALVVGLANQRSIAWGIARALHAHGAELALSCQDERLRKRAERLAGELGAARLYCCDVRRDEDVQELARRLGEDWKGGFDVLVHSLAFAPREQLQGGYLERLDREGFQTAHDISVYSFSALAGACVPLLRPGAALLTLSYLGAERAVPNYNLMGLAKASLEASVRYLAADLGPRGTRVNAISAGPVRTLASAGIGGFRQILERVRKVAPLRRNVSLEDIGNAAVFLCSELATGVTGQILYVDCGYQAVDAGAWNDA